MAIKKFYSNKAKPGWRWDEKTKKFSSWGTTFVLRTEAGSAKTAFLQSSLPKMPLPELEAV